MNLNVSGRLEGDDVLEDDLSVVCHQLNGVLGALGVIFRRQDQEVKRWQKGEAVL